jgi:ribosomal protein S18 acetylase RimI-like enzyme
MTHREALEVLAARRGQHLVLSTHGSVDLWVSLSDTLLDFSYVPTAMGQAPALGLGLALAQARHGVVVVCGDGHLLMNLGCLVTLANYPADLYLMVIDNGVYEVTGGQPVPGAGQTDFAALARAAGFRRVYFCQTAEQWRARAAETLSGPGPVLIWLQVIARPEQRAPTAMRPMHEQLLRLRQVLGGDRPSEAARVGVTLRTELRPGDLGTIVSLHGTVYAKERGFDSSFEAYVAAPLAQLVCSPSPRQRLWIAERDGRMVGCVAIVVAAPQTAQLRWFLVEPATRGMGLGKLLLEEALAFCRECGYEEVILWTESALTTAARLYEAAGFRKTAEKPGRMWGVELVEEKYELRLRPSPSPFE